MEEECIEKGDLVMLEYTIDKMLVFQELIEIVDTNVVDEIEEAAEQLRKTKAQKDLKISLANEMLASAEEEGKIKVVETTLLKFSIGNKLNI